MRERILALMVMLAACDHVVRVDGCPDGAHQPQDLSGADPPRPGEPCRHSTDPCLQCLATSCTCLAGPTTLLFCSGCPADGTCPSPAEVCTGLCVDRGGWSGR